MFYPWTIAVLFSTIGSIYAAPDILSDEVWRWECISGKCEKLPITPETQNSSLSLAVCKMYCNDFGNIWPRPTEKFEIDSKLVHLNRNSIDVVMANQFGPAADLIRNATSIFQSHVQKTIPKNSRVNEGGKSMMINIHITDLSAISLTLETDESYVLEVSPYSDGRLNATITAQTFFGARHALESLEQIIVFDNIRLKLLIPAGLHIVDKPVYPYRGLLLDTSRNYITIDAIKRTIDAMGACKLNRFHWHITDSQSFPFVSKSQPHLSKYGAISPSKVYTPVQILDVVQYALERGVSVIPEFDAPAHVGEGWQGTNLTVCFKKEPWASYCVEPPCGQLDPTQDRLYDVLQDIYSDMFELFKPDMFHMGGDEVKNECWNTSKEIQDWMLAKGWNLQSDGFFKLWEHFQRNAQNRAYKANGGKKLPLVLWTSTLTDHHHIEQYLSKEDYIIQIWTTAFDPVIKELLKKDYRLIFSNYDALYFDCGFGAWVGEGNNWCSPYIGWQNVYNNSPAQLAGNYKHLVLGAEAAVWSEQVDSSSLDNRMWPRAGALAERLWAEPNSGWRAAERRMLEFRERIVKLGVSANTLQPEWCYQNEGYCYA